MQTDRDAVQSGHALSRAAHVGKLRIGRRSAFVRVILVLVICHSAIAQEANTQKESETLIQMTPWQRLGALIMSLEQHLALIRMAECCAVVHGALCLQERAGAPAGEDPDPPGVRGCVTVTMRFAYHWTVAGCSVCAVAGREGRYTVESFRRATDVDGLGDAVGTHVYWRAPDRVEITTVRPWGTGIDDRRMRLPAGALYDTHGSFTTPAVGPYVTSLMLATDWRDGSREVHYDPPLATLTNRDLVVRRWEADAAGAPSGVTLFNSAGRDTLKWVFGEWRDLPGGGLFPSRWTMVEREGAIPYERDVYEKVGDAPFQPVTYRGCVNWPARKATMQFCWHPELSLYLPQTVECVSDDGPPDYYADFWYYEEWTPE